MAYSTRELVEFLEARRAEQDQVHPGFGPDKLISFVATSAAPTAPPAFALVPLESVGWDEEQHAVAVHLARPLPRRPLAGERVAISVVDVPGYRGFQLKSPAMADIGPSVRSIAATPNGVRVTCAHVFTVRAEPSAASFFEKIPLEELQAIASAVRFAWVAVGVDANVSPRFVYGWEATASGVTLFHGDAFHNKTFYNVRRNPHARQIVADLRGQRGYALETRFDQADVERDRGTIERISSCFAAAGFRAHRVYRSTVTDARRFGAGVRG